MSSNGISILLADDNPHMLFFLKQAFQHEGITDDITHFKNGEQLLDYLSESPRLKKIDCILIDLNMPRKNGRETLTEMQQKNLFNGVPVVVMSHGTYYKEVDEVQRLGALFIEKPTGLEEYKQFARKIFSLVQS